ncbi:MFS transporter [Paramagnetospirillum kuznetsovii]|uniref:MFS transporter n=1 Tax=Paramagnetospirillum kuznetsovii TaxID=2053833 RepID=A0A364NVU5_9PROT|nr:MFS transporter [Paramagnetospirillum kuznetsovii]RAU21037.1 MFS transporter [Paramagnetospirillum kuznetsovii]
MYRWFKSIGAPERKTFWACFGGWTLDAMDAQMFSLVIPTLLASWHISKADAGVLTGATLVASAIGGWLAGWASDRYGRVLVLQGTVIWFSVFTLLIAFTNDFQQLMAARVLQGFGFGGEWAAGAVLMSEAIRSEHRGKALGAVQSGWAVGWGIAVLLYTLLFHLMPETDAWRALFMIGILPALLTIFIRREVKEPEVYAATKKTGSGMVGFLGIFRPDLLRTTLFGGLLGLGSHGGYYALMTFLPTYLKTERHLSVLSTGSYLAVVIIGSFLGYITSGVVSDTIGRRRNFLLFAICCLISLSLYLFVPISDTQMLVLGFPLGFFASGIPAGMGSYFAELFPTSVRGAGQGFCYNFGRILSSVFPILVGWLSATSTLATAIGVFAALAYTIVVFAVLMLPETLGTQLIPGSEKAAVGGDSAASAAREA